ncbi:hypothetical protein RY831_14735 [Noviherbaspirillum sp. CPCC 100848]|jgi:hypothetical protein|uniref:Uncharacterized protein n=1 Tax=Noviherbaspirillum album TaxID=3080276 RepID=A0ABU6J9X2_9BURK|nr:hypothetical protein [Noviherbaspirillum sp. CPCC 100848]MEC4720416.1 hypothetical protein [Noviherbaspirillum sp. CPCC 100848]
MNSDRNEKAKTGYDPTESGVPDEIGKSHQFDPAKRALSPDEKRRADDVLGRFEKGNDEQQDK